MRGKIGQTQPPEPVALKLAEPDRAIRPGRNRKPLGRAGAGWDAKLAHVASWGDPPDLAALLGKPQVAIRAGGDTIRASALARQRELSNHAGCRDPPNMIVIVGRVAFGEPQVAIRPS